MKKKHIKTLLSLILSFSLFITGLGLTVHASQVDISNLPDLALKVTQGGNVIGDGDEITSTEKLRVDVTFKVPVEGDESSSYTPVKKGDYVIFALSNNFTLIPKTPVSLTFGGMHVGTATFYIDTDTQMVSVRVDFDGAEDVYGMNSMNVAVGFWAELEYIDDGSGGNTGANKVLILGKEYTVNVPEVSIDYDVDKTGVTDLANKSIKWTVDISAKKNSDHVSLEGYTFSDDLSDVGAYITGTFAVGFDGITPSLTDPSWNIDTNYLSYTFPYNSTSPARIIFETEIPDDIYHSQDEQTVYNTAQLLEGTSVKADKEGEASVKPQWIEKEGKLNDEYLENGEYNKEDRTITWSIYANHYEASLGGVKITDELPEGLDWKSAKLQIWDGSKWKDSKVFPSRPECDVYDIGMISTKILLIIETTVPYDPNEPIIGTDTFINSATITWDNGPGDGIGSGEIEVGIGYNAIKKEGEADTETQKIKWTVNVDRLGQSIPSLKVYDLLVYGKEEDVDWEAGVSGLPSGITISNLTPQYGQKYFPDSFEPTEVGSGSPELLNVYEINQGGKVIADLLEVKLPETGDHKFAFKTQVVDPDVFAGNKTSYVHNTATLFSATTRLNSATASVKYKNDLLLKQMLKWDSIDNPVGNVENIIPNTALGLYDGFNYDDKSVIFRLDVNADGIKLTEAENSDGIELGKAILKDTLPLGWEFVDILTHSQYLIFEAEKQTDETLKAGNQLDSVVGLTFNKTDPGVDPDGNYVEAATATFTFDTLNVPYVILLKAKPTYGTVADYFSNNKETEVINKVTLKTLNWDKGVFDSQKVKIESNVLDKKASILSAGELKWTLDYKPYELELGGEQLVDELPSGFELRVDAYGNLIISGNITAHMLKLGANGEYTLGDEVTLVYGDNVSYNNADRKLLFEISNSKQAYRFTYITDITGEPGTLSNKVSLLGSLIEDIEAKDTYEITDEDGWATLERIGWIKINKLGKNNSVLPDVEFTLFAIDGNTIIRQGVTNSKGELLLKAIPAGQYILRETDAPSGYIVQPIEYSVIVTIDEELNVSTQIDGKTGQGSNIVTIQNFEEGTAGNLTIKKTVAGDGAAQEKRFEFTFHLDSAVAGDDAAGPFTYIGHGVPGGEISSGRSIFLEHGQSITIVGLPKGANYSVIEVYSAPEGYTVDKEEGTVAGTIVADDTQLAHFTNTRTVGDLTIKKTVAGNAGDFEKKFDFTISLKWDYDGDKVVLDSQYTYIGHGVPDGMIKSGETISLAHGESITIIDLPAGATYTVTEEDYAADGYYTVRTGDVGVIKADETKTAVFMNIRNVFYPGNLTITKTVTGSSADTKKSFDFVVTFNGATGTYNYTGVGVESGTIKSGDTISLAHGQSITITGLPEGSTYLVSEVEASAEGYIVEAVGDEGTILPNADAIAAFTNEHTISKIDVTGKKIWVGGPAEKPTIELQLYRDGVKFGKAVSLKNGTGSYTWTDLDQTDANGKAYEYTVDEVAVPENYKKSVSEDGLSVTNTFVDPDS